MKKVIYFSNESSYLLTQEINKFASRNNILQVSFSENAYGYSITYSALVLYE